ncbi:5-formyltetrahydrofolate cyclo-ligase [Microlunatus flavus]|uniref:5-formyltetrahydrofolate cyclo-ligase n=1 Tax=Microlunatus flavus TaxID=1036181 RepID=A0A1H9K0F0_9ACTN|nr:5-formyltetrahydrofolate cyclo-ligase [Microlunatus flavus]SEQ92478.1 5-formyltetrahydrofolate cyclo-ligase [Microlunatus flavus]
MSGDVHGGQDAADQAALAGAKRRLRAAVLLRRAARGAAERDADDEARFAVLADALDARRPDTVAAYLSSGDEPDTLRLVGWLAARRVRVVLPVLTDGAGGRLDEPAWAAYEGPDALRAGPLGLLEPTGVRLPARQLPEAEVVVCAGLAANRRGDRLGRGGGWYDRALRHAGQASPVLVLLNRDEVLDAIPAQPWDHRVDRIVTPDGVLECEPPYA